MPTELKPCPNPWCKPTMPPLTISVPDATGAHTLVSKMCYECGCTAPPAPTADEACANWNTRADASAGLVEAADALLAGLAAGWLSGEVEASFRAALARVKGDA